MPRRVEPLSEKFACTLERNGANRAVSLPTMPSNRSFSRSVALSSSSRSHSSSRSLKFSNSLVIGLTSSGSRELGPSGPLAGLRPASAVAT